MENDTIGFTVQNRSRDVMEIEKDGQNVAYISVWAKQDIEEKNKWSFRLTLCWLRPRLEYPANIYFMCLQNKISFRMLSLQSIILIYNINILASFCNFTIFNLDTYYRNVIIDFTVSSHTIYSPKYTSINNFFSIFFQIYFELK